MNFQQSVKTCMRKYATFDGRASRSEYWWFVLVFVVPAFVVTDLVREIAWLIVTLALMLPYVAVSFRRLHDVGRSGWWFWMPPAASTFGDILIWQDRGMAMLLSNLNLLLAFASAAIMFYWLVSPGDAEANRFGEPSVPAG